MTALFNIRSLLTGFGVVLLALFIWYGGPLFAFGPYRPFASELVRIILIALVIVGMIVAKVLKRVRANKKSDNLIAAVVKQSRPATPSRAPRPSSCASGSRKRWPRSSRSAAAVTRSTICRGT